MKPIVRWAIIGTGTVARLFANDLRRVDNARLIAVTDAVRTSAESFSRQFNVPRVCDHPEDIVASSDVDVVYVATPNTAHKALTTLCLEAGKPVLCEKPFAINANDAIEVITLARQKRVFCMEAMWMRCLPLIHETRDLLRRGAVGLPQLLYADFGIPAPFDPGSRLFNPDLAGGALLDRGIYAISLAHLLLGEPVDIASLASIGKTGVDEQCAMVLRHNCGAMSILSATFGGWTSNEARLAGSQGQVILHEPFYRPERLTVVKRPAPAAAGTAVAGLKDRLRAFLKNNGLLRAISLRLTSLRSRGQSMFRPIQGTGYQYEALEVMRALHNGELESSANPLDDTLAVLHTMDAIRTQWALRYPCEAPLTPH